MASRQWEEPGAGCRAGPPAMACGLPLWGRRGRLAPYLSRAGRQLPHARTRPGLWLWGPDTSTLWARCVGAASAGAAPAPPPRRSPLHRRAPFWEEGALPCPSTGDKVYRRHAGGWWGIGRRWPASAGDVAPRRCCVHDWSSRRALDRWPCQALAAGMRQHPMGTYRRRRWGWARARNTPTLPPSHPCSSVAQPNAYSYARPSRRGASRPHGLLGTVSAPLHHRPSPSERGGLSLLILFRTL